ncbi:hypothetical protein LBMAG42_30640 [Deltaproteobacteria bacterium]|nr:hypothetical protein LBMAG42_30640 [Deltaproteobacteria bacterium]
MGSPSERAWRVGGPVPPDFVPMQVVAAPDGSGWLFGWRGGEPLSERQGSILAVSAEGAVSVAWSGPGWVRCASMRGSAGFAVQGRPGPVFTLLAASEGGRWRDVGPIPAGSVTSVLAVDAEEAWLSGAGGLLRYFRGAFTQVSAPGDRDSTRERLFLAGEQVVLATPAGLHLAREGGARWGHRDMEGAHVRALAFPYIAAVREGRVEIGRLEPAFVSWLGVVGGEGDPAALAWAGKAMQLALVPANPRANPGMILVASNPAGGFSTTLLKLPPTEGWIGLSGAKGALALAASRELLQSGPS